METLLGEDSDMQNIDTVAVTAGEPSHRRTGVRGSYWEVTYPDVKRTVDLLLLWENWSLNVELQAYAKG